MSLLETMVSALGSMDPDKVTVHRERCVSVRDRNVRCQKCADACTSGALSRTEDGIACDPNLCIGCGTCVTACPTSAIEVAAPDDSELTRMLKQSIRATKGHPIVACAVSCDAARACADGSSFDEGAVCEVPCLGRVDESLLVGAAAYGCFDVTLVKHHCAVCPHAPGERMCAEVVESARHLLDAFGSDMPVRVDDVMPACAFSSEAPSAHRAKAAGGFSRRDAMRSAGVGAAQVAAGVAQEEIGEVLGEAPAVHEPVLAKVGANGTLPHFTPERRIRLYNYLKHVGEPCADEIRSRVIGAVTIDTSACTSCRMCTVFCPTGALFKVDEKGAWGVAHRSAACVQCRSCEQLCPAQAITVHDSVPAAQFMGKDVVFWDMPRPTWTPNKPDSIFTKVHHVIGDDLEMTMF